MTARRTWRRWAALLVVGVALAASQAGAQGTWTVEPVATAGDIGFYQSFAYDPVDGLPAVAFTDATTMVLKYAKKTSPTGPWTVQDVATLASLYGTTPVDIAFDPTDGRPAIVSGGDKVQYRKWNGSSWSTSNVETVWSQSASISLVYDAQNRATVAYIKPGPYLRFARQKPSGAWTKESVPIGTGAIKLVRHAFDSSGNPSVTWTQDLFGNGGNIDSLRFARKSGSTWAVETVATGLDDPSGDKFGSFSVDVAFNPVAPFHPMVAHCWAEWSPNGPVNRHVRVSSWDGSIWDPVLLGPGRGASIAFDAAGVPHVALEDASALHSIFLAKKVGGVWDLSEHVDDTTDGIGFMTRLRFGSNGVPGISYGIPAQSDMKFAQRSQ